MAITSRRRPTPAPVIDPGLGFPGRVAVRIGHLPATWWIRATATVATLAIAGSVGFSTFAWPVRAVCVAGIVGPWMLQLYGERHSVGRHHLRRFTGPSAVQITAALHHIAALTDTACTTTTRHSGSVAVVRRYAWDAARTVTDPDTAPLYSSRWECSALSSLTHAAALADARRHGLDLRSARLAVELSGPDPDGVAELVAAATGTPAHLVAAWIADGYGIHHDGCTMCARSDTTLTAAGLTAAHTAVGAGRGDHHDWCNRPTAAPSQR